MADAIPANLNHQEYLWGLAGGVIRRAWNLGRSISPGGRGAFEEESVVGGTQIDTLGFLAEMAFAKRMGQWPTGIFDFGAPDLAPDWEVKATTRADGCLIIPNTCKSDRRYVLLTGDGQQFLIRGYKRGADALLIKPSDGANNGRKPAIWIRQDQLDSFGDRI